MAAAGTESVRHGVRTSGQLDGSKRVGHVKATEGIVAVKMGWHPWAGPRGKWVMLDSWGVGAEYFLMW